MDEFKNRRKQYDKDLEVKEKREQPCCLKWTDRSLLTHSFAKITALFVLLAAVAVPLLAYSIESFQGQLRVSLAESLHGAVT